MRSKVVRTLPLALVLTGVSLAVGQQPSRDPKGGKVDAPSFGKGGGSPVMPGSAPKQKAPEKSKLEEMLSEALKNNPDIRVAAANLTLAEAELNRVRLQVTQKVLTLYHAIQSQQATVNFEQKQYERMESLMKSRAIDSTLVEERFAKLTAAKSKLEELEAQLPALLGKSAHAQTATRALAALALQQVAEGSSGFRYDLDISLDPSKLITFAESEKRHKAAGPMTERLRKALQTPVKVNFKDMKLDAILDELAKNVAGASFRVVNVEVSQKKISLRFEGAIPLSAILQALSDECGCCFYVREYGILASDPGFAPPGAIKVEDFLRQKPVEEPRRQSGKNPPAENVEGLVKSVDTSGLMTITIGSDAGLTKGHTLELFRLNPSSPKESKCLGTIRILEAKAHESVGQAVGPLADTPKAGDRVASRILGN